MNYAAAGQTALFLLIVSFVAVAATYALQRRVLGTMTAELVAQFERSALRPARLSRPA